MKTRSIKKITLFHLLKVFFISIFMVLITVAISYRSFFQVAVENKAIAVADIIKAGLTAHMKAGVMGKRDYFLDEIVSVHDLDSITIVRVQNLALESSELPRKHEKIINPTLKVMLETKESQFIWNDTESTVRAVIPYIANNNGDLNCLECHNVSNGTVLGGIDISMNISAYQKLALHYGYILALVLLFFASMIVFNMFHVIERYVKTPLSRIIEDGHDAYYLGKDIPKDRYKSFEFQEVAHNINDFNRGVLKNKQELEALNEEIDLTLKETMLAMSEMEEIRSNETRFHSKRVAIISSKIAQEYGLSEEEIKHIELASPLHDIGKMAIEDSILKKPSRLSEEEFEIMKTHAELGYNTLRHSQRTILQAAASIAYCHHEKFDGSGYPRGLKGADIPIYARIVAVVDVLDALLCKRVYKAAWSKEEVHNFFEKESGKHFDPDLVNIVIKHLDEYVKIIEVYS